MKAAPEGVDVLMLPSGNWVELEDPNEISERKRRKIETAMAVAASSAPGMAEAISEGGSDREAIAASITSRMTPELLAATHGMADTACEVLLKDWSFEAEISLDAMLDMTGSDYTFLQAAVTPLFGAMFLDSAPADPSDKTTPTTP